MPPGQDRDDFVPDPLLDDSEQEREGSRPGFVPEFMRKVAVAGLGALFMTEEGLRSLAGQLKLPKEMLGYILGQAEKTKDEVGRVISEELRRFLQSEKLREELLKLVAGMTIEVKAQIRLVPEERGEDGKPAEPPGPKVVVTELHTRQGSTRKTAAKKE
ncbi:MAG TPA: hypothetical protein VLQ93_10970 [Myxococcaceae bacterium]|nr:hypothetical protein [Myxococcaceae bacterium]